MKKLVAEIIRKALRKLNVNMKIEDIEKKHILKVLADADGNKSSAARILGISRKTLDRKTKFWQNE